MQQERGGDPQKDTFFARLKVVVVGDQESGVPKGTLSSVAQLNGCPTVGFECFTNETEKVASLMEDGQGVTSTTKEAVARDDDDALELLW